MRAVLLQELHQRGVGLDEPLPERLLAVLVDAVVTSPRRAVARALFSHGKNLLQIAGEFVRGAAPAWSVTPTDIPSLVSWRDDQQEVAVEIRGDEIPAATRGVLQRLFDELPYHSQGDGDDDETVVRACSYWLEWDPTSGSEGIVAVKIGKFDLTRLRAPHDALARQLIAVHGADRHAVGIFAELTGRTLDAGHLTLYLPDRP